LITVLYNDDISLHFSEKKRKFFEHHFELKNPITGFVLTNYIKYFKGFCVVINNFNNTNFSMSILFIN